ncbi:FUSC family protein [Acuticoccus sp. MNP-M23]|uniref:FUSC family protein n=1 Tax=Acuticoccus sp. MNP-M23 TaxID=3072793 RepID=UPI002815E3C3|nr:FUSC family protein [Acuticoccus sp. MNP-M23]WMS40819.1 FUSC family protein [Acuticoccus sp. MNP-M23]
MSASRKNSEVARARPDPAPKPDYRSLEFWLIDGDARPWKQAAINVVAILGLPVALGFLFGPTVAIGGFLGALPGTIGSRRCGPRNTAPFVILSGLAGLLTLHFSAFAPAIGAALAMVAGLAGRRGISAPAIFSVVVWTIYTSSLVPAEDGLQVAAAQLGGLLWSIGVVTIFGTTGEETDSAPSRTYAITFGVLFATGIAFATWVAQNILTQHGFWFPLCLALLSLPPHHRYFTRALKRVIGTAIGSLAAFLLSDLDPPTLLVTVAAIAGFLATQRLMPRSQLIGSAAITFALVLFIGEHSPVSQIAIARLLDFAAGAGLAMGLALCGVAVLRLADKDALRALQQR